MAMILKNRLRYDNLDQQIVCKDKVHKFMKKFLRVSYKKKVKVPIKKTTKSHHRLRTT